MIFPNLALWNANDPDDPSDRIDRAIHERNQRLVSGVEVSSRFDKVRGSLVVTQGSGKFLRVQHAVHAQVEIGASLRESLLEVCRSEDLDDERLATHSPLPPVLNDLAELQAAVVENLKLEAGKYVDRILAVGVLDPGIWCYDFDGRPTYQSMCDSSKLAELCGVSVIDSFPARDLSVEGHGKPMEALPLWLMFADRNPKIATEQRLLIRFSDNTEIYSLPVSDGLDSHLPDIQFDQLAGLKFLDQLVVQHFPTDLDVSRIDEWYASGSVDAALLNNLHEQASPNSLQYGTSGVATESIAEHLAARYLSAGDGKLADMVRTGIQWIGENLALANEAIESRSGQVNGRLLVASPAQYEAGIVNCLSSLVDESKTEVVSIRKLGTQANDLASMTAAILAMCHIDQLPANVPWITEATSQRILGRLTPGSPSNWRQLVKAMADFHPAPMKLRDAI